MNEEELRAIARNNYEAQMEMLGYHADGNPKDMVEVVRCKDCKHQHPDRFNDGSGCYALCMKGYGWKLDDWFCADGERR